MDNERFLRLLNSGNTPDYKTLTDEILKYVIYKASGLPDVDDIAHRALAKVEDLLIGGYSLNSWWRVQTIIKNYIIDIRRKTKSEGIIKPSYIVYVGDLPKDSYPPKDDIYKLPEGTERDICLWHFRDKLKQKDIVARLKAQNRKGGKSYVSQIITRHKKSSDALVEYRYPKPPAHPRDYWED